jgi:hypothetical protein
MNGSTVTVLEGTEILDDEHTRVIGSSFDDVLVGRAGIVDKLWGGDGDDTIDLRDGIADEMSDCGDGNDTIRLDVGVDAGPVACELINPIPPLDDVRPPAADPADPADPVAPVAPVAPVDPGADDEMSAAPATPPVMQIRLFEPLTYAAVARRQLITARFPVQSAGVRTVVRIRAYPRQARQMGLRVPRGQRYMVIGSAVTTSTRAGNLVVRPRLTFRARQALARTARQRRTSPRRIALHLDIALQQNGKQSRVIRGFTLRR